MEKLFNFENANSETARNESDNSITELVDLLINCLFWGQLTMMDTDGFKTIEAAFCIH